MTQFGGRSGFRTDASVRYSSTRYRSEQIPLQLSISVRTFSSVSQVLFVVMRKIGKPEMRVGNRLRGGGREIGRICRTNKVSQVVFQF